MNKNFMELLSPAGSPACALAAFDAGADAVYAGLSKFNARERGENFTPDMMKKVVDYAHASGKKVYLTLNTLLRETELPELLETLDTIDEIAPDGVLVQDLGVLRLARTYYPDLILHGSTQMGFHNSAGLALAKELGLSRVVLERQITMEELAAIRKQTDLELEVFVHGSLCCSLSGVCLFSSWLGGWSGNRGKCKQPCRRRYFSKQGNGFFFSPQDLSALDLLPQLRKIGVQSLKIEGRLRQPDYVTNTVSAYRMMLDCPEDKFDELLPEARNLLSKGCGRRWSHGFYTMQSAKELIQADAIGAAGLRVGTVEGLADNGFGFTAKKRVHIGDRLRIQPATGDDGVALTVTKMFADNTSVKYVRPGQKVFICCDKDVPFNGGIFKIGESFPDYTRRLENLPARKTQVELQIKLNASELEVTAANAPFPVFTVPLSLKTAEKHPVDEAKLLAAFAESDSKIFALARSSHAEISGSWFLPAAELKQLRREFWKKFHETIKPEQVFDNRVCALDKFRTDYLAITPLPQSGDYLRETVAMKPNGAEPADRRAIRADNIFDLNKLSQEAILPEFCPEAKLPALKKAIRSAYDSGIRRFRITALYGLELCNDIKNNPEVFLIASAPLPVCNSAAVQELARLGCQRVMAHIEMSLNDITALREKSILEVECFRLGRPSLLTTRAKIPFAGEFSDARNNRFELRFEKTTGLSRIFPVKVVSIPRIPGVYDFYDLRNANWKNVDSETFNFNSEWL
ncbi:MAG: U32 family peptidase [Lentisphaerae bacterium]|nr:U32 family peptidase [Lentisphaerota bacterium]